jgi:DNA polymerase III epsilon subunit-like protein
MLDLLINHEEPLIDLEAFDWFDLFKIIFITNKIETKETPYLSSVIYFYHLRGYSFHDSMEDARATATLFCLFLKEYGIDKTIYDCMQKPKKAKDKRKNIKDATSQ